MAKKKSWTVGAVLRMIGYFVLGGIIACAGIVCSMNPVTIKIADMARDYFSSNGALARDLVLKSAGVILTALFCYYIAKGFESSRNKTSFIAGAVFAILLDTTAYVIASL